MGWIRLDSASKRILHVSEPPFTSEPPEDQMDIEIPGSATEFVRTKLNGESPERWAYDPATELVERKFEPLKRAARPVNSVIGYLFSPPVWICGSPIQGTTAQGEDEVLRFDLSVGIRVRVQRRGAFFFDFGGWPPGNVMDSEGFDKIVDTQLKRARVLNAHLVCFHSSLSEKQNACINKMNVDLHNLILKSDIDTPAHAYSGTKIALQVWRAYPGFPRSFVVEEQTVQHSLERLNDILRQAPASLEFVALLNLGAVSCEEHNYPLAVIVGWTICERLLCIRRDEYLKESQNKTR